MRAILAAGFLSCAVPATLEAVQPVYPIVDTNQTDCYDAVQRIPCPAYGEDFYGQDAQFLEHPPAYIDHGDGTITDQVTGLMWSKSPSAPLSFKSAFAFAKASRLGGHDDWRVPSVKELYSLMDFRGGFSGNPATSTPYISRVFDFSYQAGEGLGDAATKRRPIDVQEWTSNRYIGKTMGGNSSAFGVNFADGRIKSYPLMDPANQMRTPHLLPVRLVRGTPYGKNHFEVQAETMRDHATGLEWQRADDGVARSWKDALHYCTALTLAGQRDWRLPDAKELHSLTDYTRIPSIAPEFTLSNPAAYLWSATTHLEFPPLDVEDAPFRHRGELAVYIAFGPALGYVEIPPVSGHFAWVDAHGAGAQRSDPKTAAPGDFPRGFGPQGDDIRGHHYVLCVRSVDTRPPKRP